MSSELLFALAGIALSVAFTYIPGLREWFAAKSAQTKQLVMLGLMVGVVASAYGLSCLGWLVLLFPESAISCDRDGIAELVRAFILAAVANQAADRLSPEPSSVQAAKPE